MRARPTSPTSTWGCGGSCGGWAASAAGGPSSGRSAPPRESAQEPLQVMEKDEAEDIHELLHHEEDTAGGLMTNEYLAWPPEVTVGEALERFKTEAGGVGRACSH